MNAKSAVFIAMVVTAILLCGTVFAGGYPMTAAENRILIQIGI